MKKCGPSFIHDNAKAMFISENKSRYHRKTKGDTEESNQALFSAASRYSDRPHRRPLLRAKSLPLCSDFHSEKTPQRSQRNTLRRDLNSERNTESCNLSSLFSKNSMVDCNEKFDQLDMGNPTSSYRSDVTVTDKEHEKKNIRYKALKHSSLNNLDHMAWLKRNGLRNQYNVFKECKRKNVHDKDDEKFETEDDFTAYFHDVMHALTNIESEDNTSFLEEATQVDLDSIPSFLKHNTSRFSKK
jgi:hypothetical protein